MGTLSLQKISANRRNAQLSTGPKTEVGKAKSALNAVKHGIFTKECLKHISDEEARDYSKDLKTVLTFACSIKSILRCGISI